MKRFAAGNIITWGDIGQLPVNISINKVYKVQFIHEMYANGITNDVGDITFNFNGFIDVEYWLYKTHNIRRGTKVNTLNNNNDYIIMDFEIEGNGNNGNLILDIKKSH